MYHHSTRNYACIHILIYARGAESKGRNQTKSFYMYYGYCLGLRNVVPNLFIDALLIYFSFSESTSDLGRWDSTFERKHSPAQAFVSVPKFRWRRVNSSSARNEPRIVGKEMAKRYNRKVILHNLDKRNILYRNPLGHEIRNRGEQTQLYS